MVVGGVPIPVSSHAERVANFALGMIIAAKEVTNPITGGPIQVRVQAVTISFLNYYLTSQTPHLMILKLAKLRIILLCVFYNFRVYYVLQRLCFFGIDY